MTKRIPPNEWTADWMERILKAVDALPGEYGFGPRRGNRPVIKRAVWWRAMLLVSRDIAMRTSKIRWVTFEQLTPDGTLVIRDDETPLPIVCKLAADTMAALEPLRALKGSILPEPTEATPLTGQSRKARQWCAANAGLANKEWHVILDAAGFSTLAKVRPVPRSQKPFREMPIASRPAAVDARPLSMGEFLDNVYKPLRLGGKSPRTLYLYRNTVRMFGGFLGRHAMLSDLNDDAVSSYFAHLRTKDVSPHTVRKEYCQLTAMWRFACTRHLLADYPTVDKPKIPRTDPKSWLPDDVRKLFNTIGELEGEICGVPAADWWRALHYLIWNCGERISAVLALKWTDFDLDGRWVTIRAEYRKGGGQDLTSQIADYTVDALRKISRPKRELVFPWTGHPTYIWQVYGRILKRAGLPNDRGSKFHRMRRTVASQYQLRGGDATQALGHEDRRITERHYLDPRVCRRPQIIDLLGRPDKPS